MHAGTFECVRVYVTIWATCSSNTDTCAPYDRQLGLISPGPALLAGPSFLGICGACAQCPEQLQGA
jgi:hypothetical protein